MWGWERGLGFAGGGVRSALAASVAPPTRHLCACRLWGVQTAWLLTCGATFELLGSALVLWSVPCEISAGGSLVDPKVVPRQFDGGAMRVLMLLPDTGYDVTQVTGVGWTQRSPCVLACVCNVVCVVGVWP
jgi:hypothetical protein